jgi:hypothetical protein
MRWLLDWRHAHYDTQAPPIRPPRVVYCGFDWTQTERLKPTGAAALERMVEARYQPNEATHD